MGRNYRPNVDSVLVTAPQDLAQITGAAGKMIYIVRRWVYATDTNIPNAQMLQLRERVLPATVTNGSGGTNQSGSGIAKVDLGDANASFTALFNNTTKATTTGTPTQEGAMGCHIYNGFDDVPLNPYPIGPGESYVFELESTVSGTVHLSVGVEVEEEGG
jgi:hypothetical protein